MSSLLEQAIVDATALKEAALKTAENDVLEKYSAEVKNALGSLLEQDIGMPLDAAAPVDASFIEDIPLAHEDSDLDGPGDEEVIEIDFDDLKARLHAEEEAGLEPDPSEMLSSEETAEEIFGVEEPAQPAAFPDQEAAAPDSPVMAEKVEVSDELIDAIAEELTVDVAARLGGWSPLASAETQSHAQEMGVEEEAAAAQSEEVTAAQEKNLELYESRVTDLHVEIGSLKSLLMEAKEQLSILILENAKLLYQNKALNSASLNERQKEKIVEAVRNASSVEETKMLFETLQSVVGAPHRGHKESLREVVSKPTTTMLLGSNRSSNASTTVDPNMDRMLRLAGLKQ